MILGVRPAQLANFIKKVLLISRQNVQDKNGRVLYVDPASVFGIKMLRNGIFEAQKTQLVQSVLRPSRICFDESLPPNYHLPGLEGTLESLGELERNCNLNW